MMKALHRKLWRNLREMKGQALAIALVIICGVATFVMSLSTLDSLRLTQLTYYHGHHFADVFVSLKRAPERMRQRILRIPGVDQVETRVVAEANLDIKGFFEPVRGQLISVPEEGNPLLNQLYIRQGRTVRPDSDDEAVIHEVFAEAHGFKPGDTLSVIINGRRRSLTIVGIALSPEYVYQIAPGALFPDFERYGVIWMGRKSLAAAYDMEGAFNNVVLTLSSHARLEDVIDRLDNLLEDYGGLGAYGRKDQISHRYLQEEMEQLQNLATILPIIFFGVAAFLLNIVITRLISTQREEIATLKAFGYHNSTIGLHYFTLVMVIVLLGISGGLAFGVWMGKAMSRMYIEFYRFPFLKYTLRPSIAISASLISIAAAAIGTFHAVRKSALLPPAEAMRPEPPKIYRETIIERLPIKKFLSQPTRMIARHLERRPLNSLLTVVGIALSCAIVILGFFFKGAVDFMVDVQFGMSRREDLSVTFFEPTSRRAFYSLVSLPGVEYGEMFRSVPVRLKFRHRSYRTAIEGLEKGGDLYRLLDTDLNPITLPPEGIVLTDYLGKILKVSPGDRLTVEVLEGAKPVREVTVAGLVKQYMGASAYMELEALNRLMHEGRVISGAHLAIDTHYRSEIYAALKKMPRIAGTVIRKLAIEDFYETMAETVFIFTFFITLFAGAIAFGVVYNSARIALSERSRELGSLRVLGFTRGEVSYVLLGELGVLIFLGIPLGFFIGRALAAYTLIKLESDLFRIPLIIEPNTYAFAATVVLVSGLISGFIIRRKLDTLDLIGILKTRE